MKLSYSNLTDHVKINGAVVGRVVNDSITGQLFYRHFSFKEHQVVHASTLEELLPKIRSLLQG